VLDHRQSGDGPAHAGAHDVGELGVARRDHERLQGAHDQRVADQQGVREVSPRNESAETGAREPGQQVETDQGAPPVDAVRDRAADQQEQQRGEQQGHLCRSDARRARPELLDHEPLEEHVLHPPGTEPAPHAREKERVGPALGRSVRAGSGRGGIHGRPRWE
jgi:hypothetical protein